MQCKECGASVSDRAETCPSCGIKNPAPESKVWRFIKYSIAAILIASMVRCITDTEDRKVKEETERQRAEAAKTPEQRAKEAAQKAKEEAEFQSVVTRLQAIKNSTKNPKSFEVVDAVLMKGDVLCVSYRGTNSFNAIVTEHKAVSGKLKFVDWNQFCANKTGQDMGYARQALQ